eukprot:4637426-Pyramimonas_sp.AAC.1
MQARGHPQGTLHLAGRSCLVNYGAAEWHWRIVLAGLVSSDSRALILTPDGDMYIEDFNDAVAVRWLGPNNE